MDHCHACETQHRIACNPEQGGTPNHPGRRQSVPVQCPDPMGRWMRREEEQELQVNKQEGFRLW